MKNWIKENKIYVIAFVLVFACTFLCFFNGVHAEDLQTDTETSVSSGDDEVVADDSDDEISVPLLSTASNVSDTINIGMRSATDYLGQTTTGTYLTPDLTNTNDIGNTDITLSYDSTGQYYYYTGDPEDIQCYMLMHLIDDNFMIQRIMFISTTIQALMLFVIILPKVKSLGNRVVNRDHRKGVPV